MEFFLKLCQCCYSSRKESKDNEITIDTLKDEDLQNRSKFLF